MIKKIKKIRQRGEVSLFVVIFSTLLITVVVVSFVRIMVADQQQASNADLSQSAYDSAQAGVEDAKRAILRYQSICSGSDAAACSTVKTKINSSTCNDSVGTLNDVSVLNGEVKVEANNISNSLNQAYTCVKVNLQTDDYIGSLSQGSSEFVPLVGVSDFNTIKVEWFSAKDLQGTTTMVNVPSFSNGTPLLEQNSWVSSTSLNRPSILRTQLIQFNNGFNISSLDDTDTANGSNNTLFLYPTDIIDTTKSFVSDGRGSIKSIVQAHCNNNLADSNYACWATIALPQVVINDGNHKAYLNLSTIYKNTNYRITLLNGSTPVKFDAVQPEIDSTGRANDSFRRVQSRVTLIDSNFPYPEAAIDLTGNLCKSFLVTNSAADYQVDSICTL